MPADLAPGTYGPGHAVNAVWPGTTQDPTSGSGTFLAHAFEASVTAVQEIIARHTEAFWADDDAEPDFYRAESEEIVRRLGLPWRSMADAPRDGSGVLAYGVHPDPVSPEAARGVRPGDHWWSILLWGDAFRPGLGWVFAKDGAPAWGAPLAWAPLTVPAGIAGP